VPQASSVIARDRREYGNIYTFQGFMRLLRSLYPRAMTVLHSLIFDTHGRKFYRFFALEFLFLLILVNFGYWLKNPFTLFRIITWIILGGSFVLAGYAIYQLLQDGKPQISVNIETTTSMATSKIYKYIRQTIYSTRMFLDIEATTNLVTSGIYEYIRHPLYSSLILLGAVTLIKNPSLLATSLFSVATVFLYATARIEEKENLLKFGEDYAVYMERSNMFIPFL
jgi:protein-S-isoprenylcysteine O-methyltransferase Ste14